MERRSLLKGGAMALGGLALAPRAFGAAPSLAEVAREAWLYTVPLVEVAKVRERILRKRAANGFVHNRNLTTVASQRVTSPNNDTLYSHGVLDLRAGAVALRLPPTGNRYLSVQLVDMYSNNLAVLGTRATGRDGGHFLVAGPTGAAPATAIRAPSDWVFVLARTLIDDEADLAAAHAVQDGLVIEGASGPPPTMAVPARDARWADYFGQVGGLIAESPPPPTDDALLARIAPIGLSRSGFRPPAFSADEMAQIETGLKAARAYAAQPQLGSRVVDGWAYPAWNLGRFEQDYGFRAQIAVSGLFALPLDEALYTRSVGDAPDGLFHGDAYHVHFAAEAMPPVDAFWSMTLYEATPEGQFFFTPNAIDRFAIGSRTPDLLRNPDGSLDIWISRAAPSPQRRNNWLPAPLDKPFILSMRAFLPRASLLNGSYHFPPVLNADCGIGAQSAPR